MKQVHLTSEEVKYIKALVNSHLEDCKTEILHQIPGTPNRAQKSREIQAEGAFYRVSTMASHLLGKLS